MRQTIATFLWLRDKAKAEKERPTHIMIFSNGRGDQITQPVRLVGNGKAYEATVPDEVIAWGKFSMDLKPIKRDY